MVNTLSAIALVIALAAPGTPGETQQVTVSVIAVQATNEGRAAQREEPAATEAKPKRTSTSPFLQQGFAPGLRNKPKPKNENNGDHRYFEAGLEGIRDAASTLPYDTFKKIKSESATVAFGKEAQFEINGRYTLRLAPIDRDGQGRVRAKVSIDERIDRAGEKQSITALETTSAIAPTKYLVLGGRLPLDEGQLVLFVSAK